MQSRQDTVLVSSIVIPILPGLLVFWRLYSNVVVKNYVRLADAFIFLAIAFDVTALACSGRSAYYGLGKHILDPTFSASDRINAMRFIFYGEVTNLLAMLFAKLSIVTFLLYLDFAKRYKIIMWTSVVIVLLCNGVLSLVSILAACHPIAMNWDASLPGTCWPRKVNTICGYVQSGSNIVTDLTYAASPILYLSAVQLPTRTQWGLRIVFLFGILLNPASATVCSVVKLTQLKSLESTDDPTWDSVDLTVWSTAEVNVAIFAACLPPLRSQFEYIVKRIVGPSLRSSRGRTTKTTSIVLQHRSRTETGVHENDYGSELSILSPQEGDNGITKTVNVRVVDEEGQIPSPHYVPNFGDHDVARKSA